jgi:hypothetical protein
MLYDNSDEDYKSTPLIPIVLPPCAGERDIPIGLFVTLNEFVKPSLKPPRSFIIESCSKENLEVCVFLKKSVIHL